MTAFDPAEYKQSTREQWQDAAEAWHRWGPTLEEWLGEATELMLDLAGVQEGARVLDVAAGAGGQTLAAARRVGPSGAVLATDISSNILELAAAEARAAGLTNVPR
jgi:ubiquinone/menaquinone biosynthesis C-methylase UbiE